MKTFPILVLVLCVWTFEVCQTKKLIPEPKVKFDCDNRFKQTSKLIAEIGTDYDDPVYLNRNKNKFSCVMYYLHFIESLGFDSSELKKIYLPKITKSSRFNRHY
jgi:hypothetical protein